MTKKIVATPKTTGLSITAPRRSIWLKAVTALNDEIEFYYDTFLEQVWQPQFFQGRKIRNFRMFFRIHSGKMLYRTIVC